VNVAAFRWTERQERQAAEYFSEGLLPGRIVGEHRTHYQVATGENEISAEVSGALRNSATQRSDLPGVGDFVVFRPTLSDGPATIEAVLERKSALIRKASGETRPQLLASNVDAAFIVMGLDGDFNLARLKRFLDLVQGSGASPVILANKPDLSRDPAEAVDQIAEIAPGVPVHIVGAREGTGLEELEAYFHPDQTIVLVGSSGVGKSTLINRWLGRDAQATQAVRAHDNRGRHTTTHRQLFIRPGGGSIIDTPGVRGLETWEPVETSEDSFEDIDTLAANCKFRNCRHDSEPACAVRAAIENGELTADRLTSFTNSRHAQK
jgi:ribosome biogenesis GTPase